MTDLDAMLREVVGDAYAQPADGVPLTCVRKDDVPMGGIFDFPLFDGGILRVYIGVAACLTAFEEAPPPCDWSAFPDPYDADGTLLPVALWKRAA